MPKLETFAASAKPKAIQEAMLRDGAAILGDAIPTDTRKRMMDEVMPFVEKTATGGVFTGRKTRRTGALIARTQTCRDIAMHDKVLRCANKFLEPYTDRIILHLTQTIYIGPGQGTQLLHRDRLAWGSYIPATIEPQFNTIWALTDFTKANGATRVVPGSPHWDVKRKASDDEIGYAEMSAGSVLLYSGSVIHGGGENTTSESRMGLNITYCLGWLRQEENQYLSCPPHIARDLDPGLQELLGYTQGTYALGYYTDPDAEGDPGITPPEHALGRKPRKRTLFEALKNGIL